MSDAPEIRELDLMGIMQEEEAGGRGDKKPESGGSGSSGRETPERE